MKRCFKCGEEKPLDDFYAHPRMSDGHLNKCKDCTKRDVKVRYDANPEKVAEYERKRFKTQERKASVLEYQRTRRAKNPEKNKARADVGRALKNGTLTQLSCEVCGSAETEAHHEDYSKPLDVRWLCFKHHREAYGQVVREIPTPTENEPVVVPSGFLF